MDLSTSSVDDEGGAGSKEQLVLATKEVKKAHSRNRKKRAKVLSHVVDYLDQIIPAVYEQHKNPLIGSLVESMDELRDLFLEVLKLLLPLLEQGSQTETVQYDGSNYSTILESFVMHLKQWCTVQESNTGRGSLSYFLDLTSQLLTGIVELIAESESWRYVEVLSTPVAFVLLQWGDALQSADKLLGWTKSTAYSMNCIEKRIAQCGDFDCQYFLVILIQQWLTWAGRRTALNYLEAAFLSVSLDFRMRLLETLDFDYGGRAFLNALNAARGPRAKGIFSIRCLYFFAGDEELKPPEDSDQLWTDFSVTSRRIHSFISTPTNSWVNLNIGFENIDSICVSWLRRGNDKSQMMSESCTQTQGFTQDFTQMSNLSSLEPTCLMFLHIQLNDNFSEMNQELHEYHDKDIRSLTLVFQDLSMMERVLLQMSFPTHSNGEQCVRPPALVNIIEGPPVMSPNPDITQVSNNDLKGLSPIIEIDLVPETLDSIPDPVPTPMREALQIPKGTPYPARKSPETREIDLSIENGTEHQHPHTSVGNRLATPGRLGYFGNRELSILPPGTPHPRFMNDETPSSNKENCAINHSHHDFIDVIETPGGFHVPVSSSDEEGEDEDEYNAPGSEDMFSDEDEWNNHKSKKFNSTRSLNVTMESMMEDPIPRSVREKLNSREGSDNTSPKSPSIIPLCSPVNGNDEIGKEKGRRNKNSDISLFHSYDKSRQSPYVTLAEKEPLPKSPIIPHCSPINGNGEVGQGKQKGRRNKNSDISLFQSYDQSYQSPYVTLAEKEALPKSPIIPPCSPVSGNGEIGEEPGRLNKNSDTSHFQSYDKSRLSPYVTLAEKETLPKSPVIPRRSQVHENGEVGVGKEKSCLKMDSDISLFQSYSFENRVPTPIPRAVRKKLKSKRSDRTSSPSPIPRCSPVNENGDIGKEKRSLIMDSNISLFQNYSLENSVPNPVPRPVRKKLKPKGPDRNSTQSPIIPPCSPVNEQGDVRKEQELLNVESDISLSEKENSPKLPSIIPRPSPVNGPGLKSNVRGRTRQKQPAVRRRLMQSTLSITRVEHNPVPKVSGRSPCYRDFTSRSNSTFLENGTPVPPTQFVDPYDITVDEDFLKEKLTKTYSRKRKRKPVAQNPRNISVSHNKTDSEDELEKLVQNLQEDPVIAKKKRGRAQKPVKLPKKKAPAKPRAPRKKSPAMAEILDCDNIEDLDGSPQKPVKVPKKKAPAKPRAPRKKSPAMVETWDCNVFDDSDCSPQEPVKAPKKKKAPAKPRASRKKSPAMVEVLDNDIDNSDIDLEGTPQKQVKVPKKKAPAKPRAPRKKSPAMVETWDRDVFDDSDCTPQEPVNVPKKKKAPAKPRAPRKKSPAMVETWDRDVFDDSDGTPEKQVGVPKKKAPMAETLDWDDMDDLDGTPQKQVKVPTKKAPSTPYTPRKRSPSMAEKTFDWDDIDLDGTPHQKQVEVAKKKVPATPRAPTPRKKIPALDETFDWDNVDEFFD